MKLEALEKGVEEIKKTVLNLISKREVRLALIYLLFVGLSFTSKFLAPEQIVPSPNYGTYIIKPPTPAELRTLLSLKSILAPDREIVLTITDDMTLTHVSKINALPASYIPSNLVELTGVKTFRKELLRADILPYLQALIAEAARAGLNLGVGSAYRSYFQQEKTFLDWVASVGWEVASLVSARPGHSEHQLGTTLDLALTTPNFADFRQSPAAPWVAENAHRFGFVVSYPAGKEAITGYVHEPWHIRWVGIELATKLHKSGLTLEEYLSR